MKRGVLHGLCVRIREGWAVLSAFILAFREL
jgi:hypothetical protein